MTDDTNPDGQDEPTVDPTDDDRDPHDADPDDADGTGDDSGDDADVDELRTRLAESEAEAARYKRRLVASDLRKKQVERELRELRGERQKPKQDEQRQEREDGPDERDAELARLRAEVTGQKVRAQFDRLDKYQWQDPDAAWRLLDLDEVRQEDGTVDRDDLADAAAALAKARPFLLKTPDKPTPRGERPTGQQPGQHRRPVKNDHSTKFSVLRGRI